MSKEKKAEAIDKLKEAIASCSVAIFTDYRGLSASEANTLRNKLRASGIEYRVVKNTLARFAVERAGRDDLVGFFEGPVAIAFGYGEITDPARALSDYIDATKATLSIKGGFFGDSLLSAEDVEALAKVPSREVLIAMVVGGLQSPITALVNCLAAPIRGVMFGLQARIQQLEGE